MTDDLSIPAFLQMTPEERQAAWASVPVREQQPFASEVFKELRRKRQLQKLRAEERRLSKLIDEVGGHNPAARKRLYDAIKVVEKEIATLHGPECVCFDCRAARYSSPEC